MANPLILAFDMGTQSARVMLVDPAGNILDISQKTYEKPYFSPEPGYAEQTAEFYWDAICEVSLDLKSKNEALWGDIIAVTCATIRDTTLCLDKDNKPLRNVILWLDQRKTTGLSPIPPVTSMLFKVAGMGEAVALQREVSACNWIMKNEPEIWKRTNKYVFISTWLNYRFCGNLADSVASSLGHIPFDSKLRGWMKKSDMRRAIFDVENEKLFKVVEPGETLGLITKITSGQTGIPEGIPLIASGSDKACETLGLSCMSSDSASLSFGTTATIEITTPKYLEPIAFIPPFPAVIPGYYNPEVEIYRGFWLISWFKKEFAAKEVEQAKALNISAEELLNKRLAEIPPGCEGLMMQPYFTPGISMPHAKGAIIGFSDVHTRTHLYRAIIEGINFALMEGLQTIEKRGKLKIKKLFVAGGGSRSDEICQITANMFGLPVYRTQTHEVCGIGSAMTAFVAKGVFASYEEGMKSMVHIKDEFLPDKAEHRIYSRLYDNVFIKTFDKLSPLYKKINDIID